MSHTNPFTRRKLGLQIAAIAFVVSLTAACSSGTPSPGPCSTAPQDISFKIGLVPGIPTAAGYALQKYADPNVTVEQTAITSAPIGLAGLLSGDLDVLPVGYVSYIQSIARGDKITAIAGVANGGLEIVVNPSLIPAGKLDKDQARYTGDEPWKLLDGKTIATIPGTFPDIACRRYLKLHNVNLANITFVTAPSFPVQTTLVADGSVDAACGLDPFPLISRADGSVVLLDYPYPDLDSNLAYSTVLVTATDTIKSNPALVQAAVSTFVKSTEAMNKGDDRANLLDTLETYLPYPRDILSLGVAKDPTGKKDPQYWKNTVFTNTMNNVSVAKLVSFMLTLGVIDGDEATIAKNVADGFDYSFLAEATGKAAAELGQGK
jgi:ABC-type nitrate/sulfonate/bicarbonate transport system substrate-binding protein